MFQLDTIERVKRTAGLGTWNNNNFAFINLYLLSIKSEYKSMMSLKYCFMSNYFIRYNVTDIFFNDYEIPNIFNNDIYVQD